MAIKGEGKAYRWMLAHVGYQHDEWCLVWPFSRDRHGRGMMGHDGRNHWAHRFMCELAHGAPPTPQHQAGHHCGRGEDGCVNPHHLGWKTPSENATDRWKHNGHLIHTKHGTARRLVPSQARAIASAKGIRTQAELAAQFGVSENVITNIWSQRTYRSDSKVSYFTPEEDAKIRELHALNYNFSAIGREIGRHEGSVGRRAKAMGLTSKYDALTENRKLAERRANADPGQPVPNGERK